MTLPAAIAGRGAPPYSRLPSSRTVYAAAGNRRARTRGMKASSSARSSLPATLPMMPWPIERWSRFGNIQAITLRPLCSET